MPTITIDGKPLQFEGRQMILQVALENGLEIPHYCYHAGLSIVASCRICLAEVAAPDPRSDNRVELMPKLLPTCQTPAVEGMIVYTNSPKAVANQKAVMEYLLINHPVDCPVCDQAGECHLQDYSYRYGRGASRYEEDKVKQPKKDIGPHVLLYADRCIMCSRCVRFTREVSGTAEIGVFGRGHTEQIDVFPGRALDNALSGNVVDICPVGALLDKDFLFAQRVWYLSRTASIDGLTASGDNIWIYHNEGRIYRVKPRENPDVNRWWISDEIRYGWKFVHAPERLVSPMREQYGTQVTCAWDRACRDVLAGLRSAADSASGAVALLVSPMLSCEEAYGLGRLVRALDPGAVLGIGPVPVEGEDRTFPGGYTVRAEKCPNRRGVARALGLLGDDPLPFDQWLAAVGDKKSAVSAVVLTGNYPGPWSTKPLVAALARKFVVLLDTLPGPLAARANVLLPTATWVEKSGTFENADGRLQSFGPAIGVPDGARPEGRIALDLAVAAGLHEPRPLDPAAIRREMGGPFAADVLEPPPAAAAEDAQMTYVPL